MTREPTSQPDSERHEPGSDADRRGEHRYPDEEERDKERPSQEERDELEDRLSPGHGTHR